MRDFVMRKPTIALLAALAAMGGASLGALCLGASPARSAEPIAIAAPVDIAVEAREMSGFLVRDPSVRRFGQLEFRGGLVLKSAHPGFGGLSALALDARGEKFVMLSDHGDWFTGRIVYRDGQMTALANVKTAPILGADGKKLASRGWFDTESLTFDGATAYVGIERVNRIVRFDTRNGIFNARGHAIAVPQEITRLPFNRGLEALVFVPPGLPLAGTLIALSERGIDASGNLLGFLIGGKAPGKFTVRRTDGFDISDAAILPQGDLLILERKFSIVAGVGIRIRRVPLASIGPGALVDGPSIFEADLGNDVDNMEGLAVHRNARGETILTMVSDDNFSLIQRTLLLQFALIEP